MVRKEALARFPIFQNLDAPILSEIARVAGSRVYRRGEVVVREGDPGDAMYLIDVGFLKASLSGTLATATTLSLMGAGELFGEIAFLDGGPRSATVTALTRAQLFTIERRSFLRLFESQPRVGVALMEVVARRVRRLTERSQDTSELPIGSRLAKQILWLAETHGYRIASSGVRLAIHLSQKELGELVSATRESVNKHLQKWKAQRIIAEDNGYLVICNLEQFRLLATPPLQPGE